MHCTFEISFSCDLENMRRATLFLNVELEVRLDTELRI